MMMQRILIPVAHDQALNQRFEPILSYANSCHARVLLLHVIDDLSTRVAPSEDQQSSFELLNFAERQQKQRLAECAHSITDMYANIQVETQIAFGKAFLQIIEAGLKDNSDLVVIDANRGGKKYATQLGSTTRHLMRKSKIPVWTIASKPAAVISSVVAAVDVAADTDDGLALNTSIIQFAAFIAHQTGAKLTMCHAWQLYGESYLRHWSKRSDLDIAQLAKRERDGRMQECLTLLEEDALKEIKLDIELLEGQPERVLPDFIDENNIALLVMGTVCRTGLPGVLIGNTAESMLDAVNCSVVTLKPDSFESPVTLG